MKSSHFAAFILGACWSATALAQEAGSPGRPIAEEQLLDTSSVTDRPGDEATSGPVAPTASGDLSPILDQLRPEDAPSDAAGRRTDQRWKVIPYGRVRAIWDDNVFISNTDPQADFSFTLSPGIAAGWGDYSAEVRQLGDFEHYFQPLSLELEDSPQSYVFFKYVANATAFVENSGEDALDHDALLVGRWEAKKLTLGTRLRFQTLSGTDIDVGDRVKRKVTLGTVTSSYRLSEKTSVELNVLGSNYDYEDQVDWTELIGESWFNYQVLPKTRVSVGGRLGTTDIKGGSTQTFEQLVGRLSYYASTKLALSLDGGVEWRQFGNDGNDEIFSVFNFAASYAPFDGTLISTNAFRRNAASVSLVNENITFTGVSARVRQRLLHRFFLTIDGTYQNSQYEPTGNENISDRTDDTISVKPSISFDVTKFVSAETSYQFQKNNSSSKDTSFTENLVSFQINLQF